MEFLNALVGIIKIILNIIWTQMSKTKPEISEEIWKENSVDDMRLSLQKLTEELELLKNNSVLKIPEIQKRLNNENLEFYNESRSSLINHIGIDPEKRNESPTNNDSIAKFPSFNEDRRDRRYRAYHLGSERSLNRITPRRLNFDE